MKINVIKRSIGSLKNTKNQVNKEYDVIKISELISREEIIDKYAEANVEFQTKIFYAW